jgi:tetraacyldisaccharide 4'-kinase
MRQPFSLRRCCCRWFRSTGWRSPCANCGWAPGWSRCGGCAFPVVSIGNLSTGGAGKTPLTIALAKALTRRGLRVDVLSRGYGRQSQLPPASTRTGTAEEFGDEPLLIARETGVPVYVAPQRYEAGLLAEAEQSPQQTRICPGIKPTALPLRFAHLLDDGFQHRQLCIATWTFCCSNRRDWRHACSRPAICANRSRPPAAPPSSRFPPTSPELEAALCAPGALQGPVWRLRRTMEVPAVDGPVAAFCGIARPEQFFAGLEAAGLRIAARIAFPDHHRYTAARPGSPHSRRPPANPEPRIITTEKDQVRLGKLSDAFPESLPLKTASLRVEIENQDSPPSSG